MLGFASTCIASWEGILTYLSFVLTDGGTALLFWGFIACAIGQTAVYASLAEMASISPTAGGQYHWVSEFAPRRYQKLLSYLSGWLTAIGWQMYLASVCFLVGTIVQGLIALNTPDYIYERWHGTLLSIAVTFFCIPFVTFFASRLPWVEAGLLVIHIVGFFAIVGTLWGTTTPSNARAVLLQFYNGGNWPTTGLSSMIGLIAPMAVLVGYDCSVHMSEETQDASSTLPKAIMGSVLLNVTLVFIMVVTICFCLGSPEAALGGVTGYPFIQMFYNATGSYAAANTLTAIPTIMLAGCAFSEVAASSRQLWSFARDKGVPGYSWLSLVSPRWNIPLPAVIVSLVISALISLINIGSSVALQAITSFGALATLLSYYLTIATFVGFRMRSSKLPERRWSLGRFGMVCLIKMPAIVAAQLIVLTGKLVNVFGLAFLSPLIFFIMWPLTRPVTASTMNWSPVMLGGVLAIAMLFYVFKGRHEYTGPVVDVKRPELGVSHPQ
ncbi:uncharacterized protein LTR77_010261 [Saxophila tyrrhenica]|uniref:Amino acid transporter n=1 Tax=Saxophila tyrrhenica TaxID=1690608 RepID=A0AAV9NZJ8_9PEZI|nr:hypothetical protein LTR77_010261 [Saxophila tyrrhenica]